MKKIIFLMSSILMLSATFTAYAEGEVIFQDDFDEYTWTNNKNVTVENGWATFDATNGYGTEILEQRGEFAATDNDVLEAKASQRKCYQKA